MKRTKILYVLLSAALIALISGCGNSDGSNGRTSNQQNSVDNVLQTGVEQADASPEAAEEETGSTGNVKRQSGLNDNAPEPEASASEDIALSTTEGVDVDLTALSSTMVYSEVYNMMYEPDSYIGKTIKMDGIYKVYHDENTGKNYYTCIIKDATACCAQGMEFVLTKDYSFPDDYPEEGRKITVTGVFDTYTEGDYRYCTLRDASLN